jgi:hypothetical protein
MNSMRQTIENRARDGLDSGWAIAFALLRVADALNRLGTGNAATEMGALEFVGSQIGKVAEALESVASEVGGVAISIDQLDETAAKIGSA